MEKNYDSYLENKRNNNASQLTGFTIEIRNKRTFIAWKMRYSQGVSATGEANHTEKA